MENTFKYETEDSHITYSLVATDKNLMLPDSTRKKVYSKFKVLENRNEEEHKEEYMDLTTPKKKLSKTKKNQMKFNSKNIKVNYQN